MSIEIITDQDHAFYFRIVLNEQGSDLGRPIAFGPPLPNAHSSPAIERFCKQEGIGGSIPLVFVVVAYRPVRRHGKRCLDLSEKLERFFIHTDHRDLGIVGTLVEVDDIFHPGDKLSILLGWDDPGLMQMRF